MFFKTIFSIHIHFLRRENKILYDIGKGYFVCMSVDIVFSYYNNNNNNNMIERAIEILYYKYN